MPSTTTKPPPHSGRSLVWLRHERLNTHSHRTTSHIDHNPETAPRRLRTHMPSATRPPSHRHSSLHPTCIMAPPKRTTTTPLGRPNRQRHTYDPEWCRDSNPWQTILEIARSWCYAYCDASNQARYPASVYTQIAMHAFWLYQQIFDNIAWCYAGKWLIRIQVVKGPHLSSVDFKGEHCIFYLMHKWKGCIIRYTWFFHWSVERVSFS